MEGLKKGRIVHHVHQLPGMVGTSEYAAIVSRVHEAHNPEDYPAGSIEAACNQYNDGDIDLFSFMENRPIAFYSVPYSADKSPNTWHWIEEK